MKERGLQVSPHWSESIGIQCNLLWVQIPSRLTSGSTICQCFLMTQIWKHIATLAPFPLATFIHILSRKCIFPFGIILRAGSCSFGNGEASPPFLPEWRALSNFCTKNCRLPCAISRPPFLFSLLWLPCSDFSYLPGDCKCNKATRSRAESKVRHFMIPQAVSPLHIFS